MLVQGSSILVQSALLVRYLAYTSGPYSMYPIPIKMRMYSPMVTAGGGGTVKKNRAWSAGGTRKLSEAPMTASTPANLGLRNTKINPAIGINNPTTTKNTANARVRSSLIRVSKPNGVSKKPTTAPSPNKTANIRSWFPKDGSLYLMKTFFQFPPWRHEPHTQASHHEEIMHRTPY